MRADGSYVGRAAPEIDVFEALIEDGVGMVCSFANVSFRFANGGIGKVSVSAQWAPYNVSPKRFACRRMAEIATS